MVTPLPLTKCQLPVRDNDITKKEAYNNIGLTRPQCQVFAGKSQSCHDVFDLGAYRLMTSNSPNRTVHSWLISSGGFSVCTVESMKFSPSVDRQKSHVLVVCEEWSLHAAFQYSCPKSGFNQQKQR